MGYTTEFNGQFEVTPSMKPQLVTFLQKLNNSRRMQREHTEGYGVEGEFFVEENTENEPKVLNNNKPPSTQPGLWCQWTAIDENTIEWDEGEKFYNYIEWLSYIIEKVLKPNGHELNGIVQWRGEEFSDTGEIVVSNSVIKIKDYSLDSFKAYIPKEALQRQNPFKLKEVNTLDVDFTNVTEVKDNLLEHSVVNQLEADFGDNDF